MTARIRSFTVYLDMSFQLWIWILMNFFFAHIHTTINWIFTEKLPWNVQLKHMQVKCTLILTKVSSFCVTWLWTLSILDDDWKKACSLLQMVKSKEMHKIGKIVSINNNNNKIVRLYSFTLIKNATVNNHVHLTLKLNVKLHYSAYIA